jgi:dipeptidyl-peptidase-3
MIKRFLESQQWTEFHINSRLWKTGENRFEIKIASVVITDLPIQGEYQFEGNIIIVKAGDFSNCMRSVVDNLSAAVPYAANDIQRMMLGYYVNHFLTGDIETHKNSQRRWIADRGPVVETDIGFIETYLDPAGIRAEFEGFVSIVNKPVSAKFKALVDRA